MHLKKQHVKVRVNRSYNSMSAVSIILICVIYKFDIHLKKKENETKVAALCHLSLVKSCFPLDTAQELEQRSSVF